MNRQLIERWTQTTLFAVAAGIAGALMLPVLGIGLVTSVGLLGVAVVQRTANLFGAAIVLLSVGGAIGVLGLARAAYGVRRPARHNVTTTMVFLLIGVATALALTACLTVPLSDAFFAPLGSVRDVWRAPLILAAPLIWALFGIGWMQKLARRYAEESGRTFDGLPVLLLFVAIALAIAAVLITTSLGARSWP